MSRGLEFFNIELDSLRKLFASGDEAICRTVIAKGKEIYEGEDNEEMQEARFVWEEIINSLNGGKLGKYISSQNNFEAKGDHNDVISEMKSLAFACIIREIGSSIAGVFHSTGSGDIFRNEPFVYLNQSGFLGKTNSFLLLERPLFNQTPFYSPTWGGLTRTELAGISSETLDSARPSSGDSDIDVWVSGILNLIEETKISGLDLVTIYE
jgi:hypothetical protein